MRWSEKLVLVTGGAGFLGGLLVEDLVRHGAHVHVIDNFSVGKGEDVPDGVEVVIRDNVTEKALKENFSQYDYDMVFHYAAPCTILLFDKEPLTLYNNAIEASYSVRKFCVDNDIDYLIYASSATYYGKTTSGWGSLKRAGKMRYMEEMLPKPANIYGCTKTAEENFDSLFPGLNTLPLRYFPVYGQREYMKGPVASVPYKFAYQMINDEAPVIWGDGNQERDYILADDAIYLTRTLVERGTKGPYNIGTGVGTQMNNLVWQLNRILDKKIKPEYVPNPYAGSYLNSLVTDPTKLLEIVGRYSFVPIERGLDILVNDILSKM